MKIAVCYRGHFRRTYVTEENIGYDVNFKNFKNHKEKLLNNLDDIDVFFHTYESDKTEENEELVNVLQPKRYIIDKIQAENFRFYIYL